MATPSKRTLDAAGREYVELLAVKAKTEARLAELQGIFRGAYDLGPHLAGNAKVSIQRNVRRDDKAFEAAYPFADFPDYYEPKISTATIKRELAPAVLEQFQIESDYKVIVTPVED